MPKFRKKPVVIEAVQFFEDKRPYPDCVEETATENVVQTLEGALRVVDGDWIITGVNGEHYPCKPDIFEKTYEPVPE